MTFSVQMKTTGTLTVKRNGDISTSTIGSVYVTLQSFAELVLPAQKQVFTIMQK